MNDDDDEKQNPLLVNLDECLAFHLHQAIENGDTIMPNNATSKVFIYSEVRW